MAPERKKIYLSEYRPHPFKIDKIDLDFDLFEDHALVKAVSLVTRNPKSTNSTTTLSLDGEKMELLKVAVDGQDFSNYTKTDVGIDLHGLPDSFTLEIHTRLRPQDNKSFEGLYQSSGMFCTQCESQGFRRITYFIDRPDNMALFSTTLTADKKKYPYLLSNGNPVSKSDTTAGRHTAKWEDPFKKPSYLFALVAGNLELLESEFTTRSGRQVKLQIFVNPGRSHRIAFAMEVLKRAMKWDEERYGLEYDLDLFMIVAVDDFNMGAMENKGLNVFNSSLLLADPMTAKDETYLKIDAIIAHEYFHNWTGNRVTCRDWFQLSLKEGLTVYRDEEYSADMFSRPFERISQVTGLRTAQFTEDAGPNAHPVRPESCYSVENFYTSTVYQKGAEVIRMIEALVGVSGFRKGMDKYFELYDGQGVTTEDFVHAMEVANGVNLTQFKLWYSQAGTPTLHASHHYDASSKIYTLHFKQHTAPTPQQDNKLPFHIPIKVGLIDEHGNDLPLKLRKSTSQPSSTLTLSLTKEEEDFHIENIPPGVVPSLLRDFSAPVTLHYNYTDSELVRLMQSDSNKFNRWDAAQKLYIKNIQAAYVSQAPFSDDLIRAYGENLKQAFQDPLFSSKQMELPNVHELLPDLKNVYPHRLAATQLQLKKQLANTYLKSLRALYDQCQESAETFQVTPLSVGKRALRASTLHLIVLADPSIGLHLAEEQFKTATNLSDQASAIEAIVNLKGPARDALLEKASHLWSQDSVVFLEYLRLLATSDHENTFEEIQFALKHPSFKIENPNNVYALLRTFMVWNPGQYHRSDGSTYRFAEELIEKIDLFNPSVASSLVKGFEMAKTLAPEYQVQIQKTLKKLLENKKLSSKSFELINNTHLMLNPNEFHSPNDSHA